MALTKKVAHKQIVSAIDKFWAAVKSADICGRCFRNELTEEEKGWVWTTWNHETKQYSSTGCCTHCSLWPVTKCPNKPVGCAIYTCGLLQQHLRKLGVDEQFLNLVSRTSRLVGGARCYPCGLKEERQLMTFRASYGEYKKKPEILTVERIVNRWQTLTKSIPQR